MVWPAIAPGREGQPGPGQSLVFAAYRNGSPLGHHRIDFTEADGRLVVDIEIVFDVKLVVIPVYRYRHSNREVWEDGRLIALDSATDDNGEAYLVKAVRAGDRLLVDGKEGRLDLPGDTPTTSYWNEAGIGRGAWIDTQSGRLARSTVTPSPPEPVLVAGRQLLARRYDLEGDISCSLWYAAGRWVGLLFVGEDGSEITYAVEDPRMNG
jgi:hypothetical protein